MESSADSLYTRTFARLVGGLFVVAVAGSVVRTLVSGGEVEFARGAVLLVGASAGLALLRWPVGGRVLSILVPTIAAPLVAVGMAQAEPDRALFGLPYFVWLAALAGFFQRPVGAVASTVWCLVCFGAWAAFAPGRDVVADTISASTIIGMTSFSAAILRQRVRGSHATLDTARRAAEELSLKDALTGLPNRRAFEAEAQLRAIEGRLGGVLMVDIDHFKIVNDQHGHDAGDQVLKEVARRLGTAIRRADLAARLGGDEFAVLLEGPLTTDGLRRVADAVRGATSAFAAQTSAGQVRITTSIGGALTIEGASPEQQSRSARSRADNALYQAKKAGRDRAILDGEVRSPSARRGRSRPRSGPKAA